MNTNQLNYLNIGLMILSCIIAFIMPFELFLFSYAILGPLHYLTEISWLHKRQYFTPGKNDFLMLGLFALLISFANIFPYFYAMLCPKNDEGQSIISDGALHFIQVIQGYIPGLVFMAFTGSALIILAKDARKRIIGFILIAIVAWLFHSGRIAFYAFAVFLPTLVHVFIFTGIFILAGTLKSKSISGILSLVVFVVCAISLFLLFPDAGAPPGPITMRNYDTAFFMFNRQIFDAMLHQNANREMVYYSSTGIMITRFIAYAYTYHYLNWFSKTSIIKWHLIPRRSLVTIVIIWILSITLYLTDYTMGIMVLYFLSYLHVIFEFPLNFHSFKDIGMRSMSLFRPKASGQ